MNHAHAYGSATYVELSIKNMPPDHEDDGGKYGECRPGVTIPYKCSDCLIRESVPCKCKWKCDRCGAIADVDDIDGLMVVDHLRENGKKCGEYRPGVTIPYFCHLYECHHTLRKSLENEK